MSDPNYETIRSPKELYNAGTDEEHPLKALSRPNAYYARHPSHPDEVSLQFTSRKNVLGKWSKSDIPADRDWDISTVAGRSGTAREGDSYAQVDEHKDVGGTSTPASRTSLYTNLQHFMPEHRFHVPTRPSQDVQGTMFSLLAPRKVGHVETHSVTTQPQSHTTLADEDDDDGPTDEELDAIQNEEDETQNEEKAPERYPDTAHAIGLATVRAGYRERGLSTYMLGQRQAALRGQKIEITADPFRSTLGAMASIGASKRDAFARAAPSRGRQGKYLTSETSEDVSHTGDFGSGPYSSGTPGLTDHMKALMDDPARADRGEKTRYDIRVGNAQRNNARERSRIKEFHAAVHQNPTLPLSPLRTKFRP